MSKRYLTTISREEALYRVMAQARPVTDEERIAVTAARGRILSRPVTALLSNPPFTCSAMDGYAVDFETTLGADLSRPLTLSVGTGALRVNTGDPLPVRMNAVIMAEEVEESPEGVTIRKPAFLWQNVRMVGEDVIEGDLLLPPNHRVRLLDLGMLLSAGVTEVWVRRRPRIFIVTTGRELLDILDTPGARPDHGRLIDFNSHVLAGLAEELGFEVVRAPIAVDRTALVAAIQTNCESVDVMVINAGSSAGTEDFTEGAVRELGDVLFHGVAMMPGKPVLFGLIRGRPVFGIPGYPVSAVISARTFLEPLYHAMTSTVSTGSGIVARTAYPIPSTLGTEEIVRVNLVKKGGRYYTFLLPRGASLFSSLARADALLTIPANVEGYPEGEDMLCELLRPLHEIDDRICIAGSHDLSLDVLRTLAKERRPGTDLISLHVGSLGGLTAFSKGVVDLATCHILDEDDKVYNIPAVKRYVQGKDLALVHVAKRVQGLVVAPGNPRSIRDLSDVADGERAFINRQSGSGTRILLDALLAERGIDRACIRGYEREESTHTAVALLVKEGIADAGLAVYSAARLFGLDFVPLAEEDYDMVVAREFMETERFSFLMDLLSSTEFKTRLLRLGGYSTSETGRIKYAAR